MAGNNGHASHASSQVIPPTITRIITRDVLGGSQSRLAWVAREESPVYPGIQIVNILYRYDANDNPDAIEVYGIGSTENRVIGVRSTIRIEDVFCTDEVMDVATMTDVIAEATAEEEEEDESDDPEPEPSEPELPKEKVEAPAAAALPVTTSS
jgi:hypothetical protein